MNFLDSIKKAAAELVGAKRSLNAEIEGLRQRIVDLQKLPLPRHDVIAALHEQVDVRAARWSESFVLTMAPLRNGFDEHQSILFLESHGSYAESGKVYPDVLYSVLAPAIKKTIADELGKMAWPARVGPPRAERARELAKLTKQLGDLKRERGEILQSARSAGIDLDAMDPGRDDTIFAGGKPTQVTSIDKARQRA